MLKANPSIFYEFIKIKLPSKLLSNEIISGSFQIQVAKVFRMKYIF